MLSLLFKLSLFLGFESLSLQRGIFFAQQNTKKNPSFITYGSFYLGFYFAFIFVNVNASVNVKVNVWFWTNCAQ